MSYQVSFLDNQVVTAEAINSITEELGGIALDFQDDMVYGVDDLNQIAGSLIEKGVARGCELSASSGTVHVGSGVLFMGDGKRVEIDSEGLVLSYEAGVKNYVWFYHDTVLGFVVPRCTTTAPAGEDYVLLGEIATNGSVSGHADRAVMKNSYLGTNHTEYHTMNFVWDAENLEETLLAEIELQAVGYRFVIAYSDAYAGASPAWNCFCGFVDLQSGECYSVMSAHNGSSSINMGFARETDSTGKVAVGLFESTAWRYCYGYLRFELGSDNVLRVYRSGAETNLSRNIGLPEQLTIQLKLC